MRIYLDDNVLEAAKKRIRWILDEFEHVCVNVSGGKDSQVCYELTYRVAEEMGELPIYCFWMDQECEYLSTVDIVKPWMERDGVNSIWTQIPKRLPNPFSQEKEYMTGWHPDKEDKWVREKDPMAIHENTYIDPPWHFEDPFGQILQHELPEDSATIGGVRTEESPIRYLGVTQHGTYKGITYGTMNTGGIPCFYPIYDWTYSDEWKFIHENDLDYHPVYDFQHRKGVPVRDMRCGNLNSELASGQVERLQEFEPETWDRFTERWPEIQQAANSLLSYLPDELPMHFDSWREYRNYLLEKLVDNEEHKRIMYREFFNHDLMSEHLDCYDTVCRGHCRAILKSDWDNREVLASLEDKFAYPENAEVKKRKKGWLQENGYWDELKAEGVVG